MWLHVTLVPFVIACLFLILNTDASNITYGRPYYSGYSSYSAVQYLPAPPGKRPACAGPSDTFCTTIDYYPTEIIEHLVKRYSFDFKTLLQDESTEPLMLHTPSREGQATSSMASTANMTHQHSHGSPVNKPPFMGPHGKFDPIEPWWIRYTKSGSRRPNTSMSGNLRVARQTSNEEKLCPTTAAFITPRAAINTRGNWMYVVNLENEDQQTRQLVQTEKCATSRCSGLCQVPAGFTSSCEQQFVQKRLIALNGNGESLYTDTFWFPHCCICRIRTTS